ncbi:hypothetical protein HF326_18105 [Bacillus altitudinis MN12]|uniref:hypothetical protein n=1 Tax=Bacillus TaxID=1386 RepID=UPI0011A3535A|nr:MULTISPECIES: hypothetical protein [Bacillus]MBR0584966.1 hypothetical protein [Bacillus altitudinis MN12]MBR0595932.1 hypothetical protein [Bacillus altitudinis C16B11]MBR0610656.1 hypothetical protein [Bacillus altitudinis]MCP1150785.1 hypothetical protein [Bacillus sp. 1735sda2]
MIDSYVDKTLEHFKINETNNLEDYLKRLYFIYPTLHVNHEELGDIINEAQKRFNTSFHRIKVIGSKHQGFSFMDKNGDGEIKYVQDDSDIDLAIIDSYLFNKLSTNTLIETNNFQDKTKFKPDKFMGKKNVLNYFSYYRKNLISGFIRPDSLGCYRDRKLFKDFSEDMKSEYDIKISAAVYLNEISFIMRLDKQIRQFYEMRVIQDGLK